MIKPEKCFSSTASPLTMLTAMIALLSVLGAWNEVKQSPGADFYQFWLVGREIGKPGAANVYTDEFRHRAGEAYWQSAQAPGACTEVRSAAEDRRVLETYSTPALYCFFHIVDRADYQQALWAWKFLMLVCAVGAIAFLGRMMDFSLCATLAIGALVLGTGEPFRSDAGSINVDQIQLFAVAVLLLIQSRKPSGLRDLLGGGWMAALVLFKPNLLAVPALLAVDWIVARDWSRLIRQAMSFAVVAATIVIASSFWFHSPGIWLDWTRALVELDRLYDGPQADSYSLRYVALLSFGRAGTMVVTFAVSLAAMVSIIVSGRRIDRAALQARDERTRTMLIASLGCVVALLSGVLVWVHYYMLCVPLLLLSLRPRLNDERLECFVGRCALGALVLLLSAHSELISQWISLGDHASVARRLSGSAASLFVWGLFELHRIAKPADPGLISPLSGEPAHASSNIR